MKLRECLRIAADKISPDGLTPQKWACEIIDYGCALHKEVAGIGLEEEQPLAEIMAKFTGGAKNAPTVPSLVDTGGNVVKLKPKEDDADQPA